MAIVTVPSPVPLAPDVIVMNDALLVAVHAHVLCADTFTVAVLAPLETEMVAADRLNEQMFGVRNDSAPVNAVVSDAPDARARQSYVVFGFRLRATGQLVVAPPPWAMPSAACVRESGNESTSDTSNR